jgi:pimeloyl-ACP methyl ester carboxylesterase
MDINWEINKAFVDKEVTVPALFIAGTEDPVIKMGGQASLDKMQDLVNDLRGLHVIEGAGHFVQQEKTEAANRFLLDFLNNLDVK